MFIFGHGVYMSIRTMCTNTDVGTPGRTDGCHPKAAKGGRRSNIGNIKLKPRETDECTQAHAKCMQCTCKCMQSTCQVHANAYPMARKR